MYSTSPVVGSSIAAGGALAATGMNVVWMVLAGFALLGAGLALLRLVPRSKA